MLDAKRFEVDRRVRTTHWPLDPAIDLAASDLAAWFETGDGLIVREHMQPAAIEWRPLNAVERGEVQAAISRGIGAYGVGLMTCAYGLLRVDGIAFQHERPDGVRRITADTLALFEELGEIIPGVRRKDGSGAEILDDEGKPLDAFVIPTQWLGGLIDRASFRGRG